MKIYSTAISGLSLLPFYFGKLYLPNLIKKEKVHMLLTYIQDMNIGSQSFGNQIPKRMNL